MKNWTAVEILSDDEAPMELRLAAAGIVTAFDDDGYPYLASISCLDDEDDEVRYRAVVELASGMTIATEYGLPEDAEYGGIDPEEDTELLRSWVVQGASICMRILPQLADELHDQLLRTRRIIAAWARDGIHARLVGVELAPFDYWVGSTTPATSIKIEGPTERFPSEVIEISVETPDQLESQLAECREDVEAANATWLELAELGATGRIDRLALNAIAHHGDTATTLRRFNTEWRFWLPDDTAMIMRYGRVTAGTGDPHSTVDWRRDSVVISRLHVPATTLVAGIGKPVTALIDHPFLTDDIIVTDAKSFIEDGVQYVSVDLDVPQFIFCSTSGRVWEAGVDVTATADLEAADSSSNVVSLRAQR